MLLSCGDFCCAVRSNRASLFGKMPQASPPSVRRVLANALSSASGLTIGTTSREPQVLHPQCPSSTYHARYSKPGTINGKSNARPNRNDPLRIYRSSPTDWQRVQPTARVMHIPPRSSSIGCQHTDSMALSGDKPVTSDTRIDEIPQRSGKRKHVGGVGGCGKRGASLRARMSPVVDLRELRGRQLGVALRS